MRGKIEYRTDKVSYCDRLFCERKIFDWRRVKHYYNHATILDRSEWHICAQYHTIYVYLGNRLRSFQANIEGGHWRTSIPLEGDIWIVPAGKDFRLLVQGTQFQFAELRIEQSALPELAGDPQAELSVQSKLALRDEFIHLGIRQLSEISQQPGKMTNHFATSLLETLCRYIIRMYTASAEVSDGRVCGPLAPEKYLAVERFIDDHLSEKITLDQLAGIAGLSSKRFLSDFTQTVGKTPIRFVINRRILKAQSLLSCTAADITDIAMTTGFSSHAHLTTTFKAIIGVSPSQYRRRARTS